MAEIVAEIHSHFPDCAITLSIGERSRESYQALFDAGADRYLLRHDMTLSITAGFILIRFLPFTDGNAFGI